MRAVYDTNILVSALLNPDRVPAQAIGMIKEKKATALFDPRILKEYATILCRPKFGIPPSDQTLILALFVTLGEEIEGPFPVATLPDKSDEKFLEVAWAGLAEVLVTGNGKHFPAKLTGIVKAMGPKEFLEYEKK